MRQTLIKTLLTLTFMICGLESFAQSTPTENRWDNLIKAISAVESKGNPKAVSGRHVGILQISPIVVDDCNRINKMKKKKEKFTYNDRYSVEKSIEMFWVIQNFYNAEGDFEKAIRLWNGGIGYSIRKTQNYFNKVMNQLKKIEEATM